MDFYYDINSPILKLKFWTDFIQNLAKLTRITHIITLALNSLLLSIKYLKHNFLELLIIYAVICSNSINSL
jgi:hypothetical protein